MKKLFIATIFLTALIILGLIIMKQTPHKPESQIIPREVLFGNPDRASVGLSHDGKYISYIAPKDNVLNIFVAPRDDIKSARPITNDTGRGIRTYFWSYESPYIFYLQDIGGDENWQLHKVNVDTLEDINLTPENGIRTQIYKVGMKFPGKIIIGTNERNKSYFDLYELDVTSNERKLIFTNEEYDNFSFDHDFNLRFVHKPTKDGGSEIYKYSEGKTELFFTVPASDVTTTYFVGCDKTGRILYMSDSTNHNTSRLISWNLDSNEKSEIFYNEKADISGVLTHPTEKTIQAVSSSYIREEWKILDQEIAPDFDYLEKLDRGEINITSTTLDNKFWVVAYLSDNAPVYYYLYDRQQKKASKLFSNKEKLEQYKLSKMHGLVIKSRDGLDLVSYLTVPDETLQNDQSYKPKSPLPLVLYVHGGPSVRDSWGFNTVHQWLANRGYAVLSVNYRGSTGLGKDFFTKGHGEWSAKMHDDLIDAVNFAIKEGITEKDKICIMGGSYGGYATLVGLTFTPDVFACGVDIVGPSNLITLLNSVPPYWKPALNFLINLTGGDPETEEGRKILNEKSPINYVDKIKKPLLIGQGANDPRVKQAESDQIVDAMKAKNIPVTYILYPDEGHGFARPENRLSFYAITEGFLAKYLKGRFEKIENDFNNSSINIVTGKDFGEGLEK